MNEEFRQAQLSLLRRLIESIKSEKKNFSTDPGFEDGVHMSIKVIEKLIAKL